MSVETIAALADETHSTLDTLSTALTEAQRFNDPDLQPHAVQARRTEMAEKARTAANESIASITARAESTAATAAKALDASRPRIADEPAALIKAEQTWKYDVRPLLDAGTPIKALLKTATADELLAIERFAPGYLRAAQLSGAVNPMELDPEELGAAVNNRLAVTLPEAQRAGFEDGIRTADAARKLQEIQGMAEDTIAGRTVHVLSAGAHARTLAIQLRG